MDILHLNRPELLFQKHCKLRITISSLLLYYYYLQLLLHHTPSYVQRTCLVFVVWALDCWQHCTLQRQSDVSTFLLTSCAGYFIYIYNSRYTTLEEVHPVISLESCLVCHGLYCAQTLLWIIYCTIYTLHYLPHQLH